MYGINYFIALNASCLIISDDVSEPGPQAEYGPGWPGRAAPDPRAEEEVSAREEGVSGDNDEYDDYEYYEEEDADDGGRGEQVRELIRK